MLYCFAFIGYGIPQFPLAWDSHLSAQLFQSSSVEFGHCLTILGLGVDLILLFWGIGVINIDNELEKQDNGHHQNWIKAPLS